MLFHDGRELTSADVVYTFRSFLDPTFRGRSGAYRDARRRSTRVDRYTVEFKLKDAVRLVSDQPGDGDRAGGLGRGERAARRSAPGPYRLAEFVPDDRVVLDAVRPATSAGAPRNAGVVLKVVPDDTMRGLELRKGTVDLVVNDLSPDIVWQLQREGRLQVATAPGTDYAYIGLNLRDPILQHLEVRKAIGYAIDRDAIVKYLRRGLATTGGRDRAADVLGVRAQRVRLHARSGARRERLLDEAGFPDPDGDGSAAPLPPVAEDVDVRGLPAAGGGHPAGSRARRHRARRAVVGVRRRCSADVLRGNFQMYTLQWVGVTDPDILRRVFHSKQAPPAGFNRVRYSNPDVDRLIDDGRGGRSTSRARRALRRGAAAASPQDVPYISLWYKTNVAVAQPDLHGVHLSPIADFTFLKDVMPRDAAPAGARE